MGDLNGQRRSVVHGRLLFSLELRTGGNIPSYRTDFTIHQEVSFEVVLSTGTFADTSAVVQEIVSIHQPALDNILTRYVSELYERTGRMGEIEVVKVISGVLSMERRELGSGEHDNCTLAKLIVPVI